MTVEMRGDAGVRDESSDASSDGGELGVGAAAVGDAAVGDAGVVDARCAESETPGLGTIDGGGVDGGVDGDVDGGVDGDVDCASEALLLGSGEVLAEIGYASSRWRNLSHSPSSKVPASRVPVSRAPVSKAPVSKAPVSRVAAFSMPARTLVSAAGGAHLFVSASTNDARSAKESIESLSICLS